MDPSLTMMCSATREFDVQRDCDEPQQEVSFLSTTAPTRRKGKSSSATPKKRRAFGVPDEEAQIAASFSIGQGLGDWGPMTVYGLMTNGDVWALCPFLPKRWYVVPRFRRYDADSMDLVPCRPPTWMP
jgi:nucleoporin NUP82